MPIRDVTADWLQDLADQLLWTGGDLALNASPEELNHLPAQPSLLEWITAIRAAFLHMLTIVQQMRRGETPSIFRKSLFREALIPGHPRYSLVEGNTRVPGRLFLLESTADTPPYTRNLRRFVAFVPAAYNRSGDNGHYAWIHFTPVWGGDRNQSPRARAVHREYPHGTWINKYIVDYLLGHRLLSSFSSAGINAVLIMPVHRLTAADALAPLGNGRSLRLILREIFECLESLNSRLRSRTSGRAGSVAGYGISCFSFGANYAGNVFEPNGTSTAEHGRLRAAAYLDGVTPHALQACRAVVGQQPNRGWLSLPSTASHAPPRRMAMYQQPNVGRGPNRTRSDFVTSMATALRHRPTRQGDTVNEFRVPPNWPNHLVFHHVHTRDMVAIAHEARAGDRQDYWFWHGRIHALFLEEAFTFCRDCFLW